MHHKQLGRQVTAALSCCMQVCVGTHAGNHLCTQANDRCAHTRKHPETSIAFSSRRHKAAISASWLSASVSITALTSGTLSAPGPLVGTSPVWLLQASSRRSQVCACDYIPASLDSKVRHTALVPHQKTQCVRSHLPQQSCSQQLSHSHMAYR